MFIRICSLENQLSVVWFLLFEFTAVQLRSSRAVILWTYFKLNTLTFESFVESIAMIGTLGVFGLAKNTLCLVSSVPCDAIDEFKNMGIVRVVLTRLVLYIFKFELHICGVFRLSFFFLFHVWLWWQLIYQNFLSICVLPAVVCMSLFCLFFMYFCLLRFHGLLHIGGLFSNFLSLALGVILFLLIL